MYNLQGSYQLHVIKDRKTTECGLTWSYQRPSKTPQAMVRGLHCITTEGTYWSSYLKNLPAPRKEQGIAVMGQL